MKTRIHVDQHAIRANAKDGGSRPVITVKDYKANRKGACAEIRDAEGNVVARVIYRPEHPLSCGARVWIETEHPVDVAVACPDEST
jgi:hypothetical protein